MEKKIDIDNKNKTIQDKIDIFCSFLMKMPVFSMCAMVDEKTNLKLVESEIIKNLFSDLNEKNRFTDDKDVCEKTQIYYKALKIEQQPNNFFAKLLFADSTGKQVADVIKDQPSFDNYKSKFKEMTNREFLKKFIKGTINLNKYFSAMPKWKRICLAFLGFVCEMSGIGNLIGGILVGSKLTCFISILVMCAWAGLICSLVFHLSLALLIPSAIILGLATICVLANIVMSQVQIYKARQEKGTDIDDFFNLVGEINQYLDTHDLPPEKIPSGEKIPRESSIDEKIQDANTKKDDKEGSDIKTKKSNDEIDGK